MKAVSLHRGIPFPYVHDLDRLVQLAVRAGQEVGDQVRQLGLLNRYAVGMRYPGGWGEVTQSDYQEALSLAEATIRWAEGIIPG